MSGALFIVFMAFVCKWGIDAEREKTRLKLQAQSADSALERRLAALEAEVKQLRELVSDAVIELDEKRPYQRLATEAPARSVDA
jgi:alkylation response protein AidB-like acyl-CoA dehydrogenase